MSSDIFLESRLVWACIARVKVWSWFWIRMTGLKMSVVVATFLCFIVTSWTFMNLLGLVGVGDHLTRKFDKSKTREINFLVKMLLSLMALHAVQRSKGFLAKITRKMSDLMNLLVGFKFLRTVKGLWTYITSQFNSSTASFLVIMENPRNYVSLTLFTFLHFMCFNMVV